MIRSLLVILFLNMALVSVSQNNTMQGSSINNQVVSYKKKEVNSGFVFSLGKEREELRTDKSRYYEERTLLNGAYHLDNKYWSLQDYIQEELMLSFELGPFGGFGNWIDSSKVNNSTADDNSYGIRTSLNAAYLKRYYYDPRNYTIFDLSVFGHYDLYNQTLKGTSIDSIGVSSPIDERDTKGRFRIGFKGKAGWGIGRLSPMNHLMTADYLLRKYYPGRVFSDSEIAQFAQVIADIKNNRDINVGHISEKEMKLVRDFVRQKLFLESPELMANDWDYAEFDPRYEGKRFELGPFFQYYNKEPDFVYGGYLQFDWAKYQSVKWNRIIRATLNYNRYKRQDWMVGEFQLGWSYYSNLRSQFDFGVKYVPGLEINGFEDIGPLSHNVIPYVAYFTQLNSKSRLRFDFAWRIADDEQFVLSGPEFSLAFYRSRY